MNSKLQIKGRAKINISIDITGKRENGYHEVKMIMQTIDLYDVLELEIVENGIELLCDAKGVPSDGRNIAYKAATAFLDRFEISKGVKIKIEKNIPVCAGLAGGSADAAAVLKGMNMLFGVGAKEDELCDLGVQLGADVPFCIKEGTMLAEGIGEKLTRLPSIRTLPVVIVKPGIDVSTKWVYQNYSIDVAKERPNTESIIECITSENYFKMAQSMKNVLESVTAKEYPVINAIKAELLESGAIGSLMSGSGSAVFGLFDNFEVAKNVCDIMANKFKECILTETFYSTTDIV